MAYKKGGKRLTAQEHRERVNELTSQHIDAYLDIIRNNQTEDYVNPWNKSGDELRRNTSPLSGLPYNPKTKHHYSGSNVMFLMMSMMANGWSDPRFLTLAQAKDYAKENGLDPKGVFIKKGSKASYILQPVTFKVNNARDQKNDLKNAGVEKPDIIAAALNEIKDPKGKTGGEAKDEEEEKVFIRFKTSARFNAQQFTGIPELKTAIDADFADQPNWSTNALVKHLMQCSGVNMEVSGRGLSYNYLSDTIKMMPESCFDQESLYSSNLLHEWMHWTGGPKRENRINDKTTGDKVEYAKEEIRAQFFMIAASHLLNIPINLYQEADYIKSFENGGKLDYKALYAAFRDSATMFSRVLIPFVANEQPSPEWFPSKDTWPERTEEIELLSKEAEERFLGEDVVKDSDDLDDLAIFDLATEDVEESRISDSELQSLFDMSETSIEAQDDNSNASVYDADNPLSVFDLASNKSDEVDQENHFSPR